MNRAESGFVRVFSEAVFLAIAAAFFLYRAFFNTTIRRAMQVKESNRFLNLIIILLVLIIFIREVAERCYSRIEIVSSIIFAGIFVASYYHCWEKWLQILPFLVIAAKDIPFDRIVKVYLAAVGGMILVAFIVSQAGYTSYLVYEQHTQGGALRLRHAFGTTYPTTFSEFIFFLSAAALYLRRKRAGILDALLLIVCGKLLRIYCDAKTGAICLYLLAVLALCLLLSRKAAGGLVDRVLRKLSALLILIFPLLSAVMVLLTIFYDPASPIMARLNRLLTGRLRVGNKGYSQYGLSLLGKHVKYYTTGGTTMEHPGEDYMNIDCSYMLVLVNFGLLVFVVVVAAFTYATFRAYKMQDLCLLGILAVIGVECAMENRLIQPQYNIFCLIFFSRLETEKGQGYGIFAGE